MLRKFTPLLALTSNPLGVEIRAVAFQARPATQAAAVEAALGGVGERAPPLTLVISPPSPLGRSGGEITYVLHLDLREQI